MTLVEPLTLPFGLLLFDEHLGRWRWWGRAAAGRGGAADAEYAFRPGVLADSAHPVST